MPSPCIDCQCSNPSSCLAAYAPDQEAMSRALDRCVPDRLAVVTFEPNVVSLEDWCNGGYSCPCRKCSAERAAIEPQGEGNANPFKVAA